MKADKLKIYRAALLEHFPTLEIRELEYHSEGWNSLACLVNRHLIFRFPKRAGVEDSLLIETRLLPELAPNLPLPIPNFTYQAGAGQTYPFAFVGYEMLPGETLTDWQGWASGLNPTFEDDPADRQTRIAMRSANWWQPPLGAFLTALHTFPLTRAQQLGVRDKTLTGLVEPATTWRETLEDFYSLVREKIYPLLPDDRQDAIAIYFEGFLEGDKYFEFEPVLVHADLLDDHVLLDRANQRLTGIIDFGSLAIGDPALDLWENLQPYYHGPADPTFAERRRFYLKLPPFEAILFGLDHSDPALVEYGLYSLDNGWAASDLSPTQNHRLTTHDWKMTSDPNPAI